MWYSVSQDCWKLLSLVASRASSCRARPARGQVCLVGFGVALHCTLDKLQSPKVNLAPSEQWANEKGGAQARLQYPYVFLGIRFVLQGPWELGPASYSALLALSASGVWSQGSRGVGSSMAQRRSTDHTLCQPCICLLEPFCGIIIIPVPFSGPMSDQRDWSTLGDNSDQMGGVIEVIDMIAANGS